jgi:hypothetical protein
MLHMENPDRITRFMQAMERLIMNVFGPADRAGADTAVIHRNDDEEAASQEQIADIEVERDNEGNSWAYRKSHVED